MEVVALAPAPQLPHSFRSRVGVSAPVFLTAGCPSCCGLWSVVCADFCVRSSLEHSGG